MKQSISKWLNAKFYCVFTVKDTLPPKRPRWEGGEIFENKEISGHDINKVLKVLEQNKIHSSDDILPYTFKMCWNTLQVI